MKIIDKNINEQTRGLYRAKNGGNEWRELGEKGKEQVLTDKEILELSELILKIENHYGFPCDIEWAYEDGKLYIVQSRPITTLGSNFVRENTFAHAKDDLEKYQFEKVFTRDTSLLIFEAWFHAFTEGIGKIFGKNPIPVPIINFMHDGLTDIYESRSAIKWFSEVLLEKNLKEEEYFYTLMDEYLLGICELERVYDKKRADSLVELENFLDRIEKLYVGFAVMFFTAIDERNPIKILERAREIRNKDHFFDQNDQVVRGTIRYLFPEIAGFEKAVLRSDLNLLPDVAVLKERIQNFVLIPGVEVASINLDIFISNHPDIDFIKVQANESSGANIITGESAYKGNIQGYVRVILSKERMGTIGERDIIVAFMTTPDFLPAMKKAAAFVTDEGGITCHAAIVARELKKPCIIGTKIATQVLHDGDLVEVDADTGVVRVLERVGEKAK